MLTYLIQETFEHLPSPPKYVQSHSASDVENESVKQIHVVVEVAKRVAGTLDGHHGIEAGTKVQQ